MITREKYGKLQRLVAVINRHDLEEYVRARHTKKLEGFHCVEVEVYERGEADATTGKPGLGNAPPWVVLVFERIEMAKDYGQEKDVL